MNLNDYVLCQGLIMAGVEITSGVVYSQVKNLIYEELGDGVDAIQKFK